MTSNIKSRLSIDLDPALHRAVKIAAVESYMTLQEVATEALRDWLQRREDREDLAAIAEVKQEPDIPWDQVQQPSIPAKSRPKRHLPAKVFTKNDALWNLVGMLKDDGGPTDVSTRVDDDLAEAYADTHE